MLKISKLKFQILMSNGWIKYKDIRIMARIRKLIKAVISTKKTKPVSGNANKLKKLAELKQVNKDIGERFKVSEKLFERKEKLMNQLGISRDI